MGFAKSLKAGNAGQKQVTDLLTLAGFAVENSVGKCLEMDFVATKDGESYSFEAKADDYSIKSGNLALEFWNSSSDKPSGLTATTADFWVTICPPNEIWIVTTQALRTYCHENKPFRTILSAGDANADLWLYRKDEITSVFVRLDKIEQESICGVLRGLLGDSHDKKPENSGSS